MTKNVHTGGRPYDQVTIKWQGVIADMVTIIIKPAKKVFA